MPMTLNTWAHTGRKHSILEHVHFVAIITMTRKDPKFKS